MVGNMKNIYYSLWADSILSFKKYNPDRTDWKIAIFILNTWVNALNFWIIFIWLKFFHILNIPLLSIVVFSSRIDHFINFTIEFAVPFGILNYFLIFHKDRYKKIIEKYPKPKRYAFPYSAIVVLGAFISAVLYGIFN